MKVVTLHNDDFIAHCRALEEAIRSDFAPDLVVAIASGGTYVAERMFTNIPHTDISARRPSTQSKGRMEFAWRVIKALPEPLRNLLRITESKLLAKRRPATEFDPSSINGTAYQGAKNILVVDDAVDSGATLGTVLDALRDIVPNANIRSAVLTITTARPAVYPDYTIYHYTDKTLLRFPWSKDYRIPAGR